MVQLMARRRVKNLANQTKMTGVLVFMNPEN